MDKYEDILYLGYEIFKFGVVVYIFYFGIWYKVRGF